MFNTEFLKRGSPMTAVHVRQSLVHALRLDLVGPDPTSSLKNEVLPQSPSRWYLTGFLVPAEASEDQRRDQTAGEEVDQIDDAGATDDAVTPEPAAARRAYFPSSLGLSILVPGNARELRVVVRWGDYKHEIRRVAGDEIDGELVSEHELASLPPSKEPSSGGPGKSVRLWRRTDRQEEVTLDVATGAGQAVEADVPGSKGLKLVLAVRAIQSEGITEKMVPKGTRSVSVFLVNKRDPAPDLVRDEAYAFQAELEVDCDLPLVPRPNLRGLDTDDWDERVADLQYRDAFEYAVGHGVATHAAVDGKGECQAVHTCWMPLAEVERVAPATLTGVELEMEKLACLADGAQARQQLGALVTLYRQWISAQKGKAPTDPKRRADTADELLRRAGIAADRINVGIDLLADPQVLDAFRIANKVMSAAARRRNSIIRGIPPEELPPPRWHPFQLAFLLMNLRGICKPDHPDREIVDLLFFPTGGGKTEAYLGLSAFTLVLRRLRNPGIRSAGLSVLMRYTLRLLTLDQLGRASALICALELERQQNADKFGDWPFEIGLWVGQAATPNRMGGKGDPDANCAYRRTVAFQNDNRKPSPIPLEECPWCGTKFATVSFQLRPNRDQPNDLRVCCANRDCAFSSAQKQTLPIVAVDEPIYRRLPCFMIATVDKFAAMPWTGEVGAFFGRVDRYDKDGFYGPCQRNVGQLLPGPLPPPDLVIQDELHLISGPMGTMVGLYETALDELCCRQDGEHSVRPKVVASTATVRRAEKQIRALFNRCAVDIFPPPGPDRRDSFFARTHTPQEINAQQYVGIAAQGRSPKVILLRTYLALLGAAQKTYLEGEKQRPRGKDKLKGADFVNPADPYMTLLGYFNSLRELGGSRRIVEDEVSTRLSGYASRKRVGEAEGLFAERKIAYDLVELTSRVSTDKVAEAKRRLAVRFTEKERVDVAIATNMISVGLDITRLGLMVVFGQPKTSAEYIQATSRVGRDPERGPGLVVTLMNVHRPRDRSHYERFAAWHQTFYRSVEATSVTPFSPRALDRGLAGTIVALARLGHGAMTAPLDAGKILTERANLNFVVQVIADRAAAHAQMSAGEAAALRQRLQVRALDLFDTWSLIASTYQNQGVALQYQAEVGAAKRLLYEFLNPELKQVHQRHRKFRANRSMRDVEPSVNLWVHTLDNVEVEVDES
jgi:hypothetical protein